MKEAQQTFEELAAFVSGYDPISLLSQLTATFLFAPEDEFQSEASDPVKWERWIEFLAGYFVVRPYPAGPFATVDGSVLQRVENLLGDYFNAIARHLFEETPARKISPRESQILAHAKIESLYVRGDAYPHQFYAFAARLYGPHDDWFRANYGFTISEGIQLARAIDSLSSDRFNESLRKARTEARYQADKLIADNQATETGRGDLEARIFCALHFGRSEMLIGFTVDDLSRSTALRISTCKAFANRMSLEFGHRNPQFPNSFTDPLAAPWDYNTLHERPLVRRGNTHWVFVPRILTTALFTTFHFDLMADKTYLHTYENARGRFLEEQTADCLRRIFPSKNVLLNPYYPNRQEMADVMVLHDHKVVVLQCKSKGLTHAARIGTDLNALRTDLQKAIAEAHSQGTKARDYLLASKTPDFVLGERRFAIDSSRVNGLYTIVVTTMPFHSFAGRLANVNPTLGLFSNNDYPWSLSLGDLDILTQVLTSPAQFIHYLLRRRAVEQTAFEIQADEIDYLGFYLVQGMYFDTSQFKEIDDLGLSGMSNDIDKWVYEKFGLKRNVEPPRSAMPQGFSDFVRDVERTENDFGTDCAMTLLDLGAKAREQFMEMVDQTKERSRRDQSLHSFSAVFKDGQCGHSFLSWPANGDRVKLFQQVASFAMLKKYQSKCRDWAGFGWDVSSPRTVDVAVFASGPWQFDEGIEFLVKEKLRPGKHLNSHADPH